MGEGVCHQLTPLSLLSHGQALRSKSIDENRQSNKVELKKMDHKQTIEAQNSNNLAIA